jgi:hypothetical protein
MVAPHVLDDLGAPAAAEVAPVAEEVARLLLVARLADVATVLAIGRRRLEQGLAQLWLLGNVWLLEWLMLFAPAIVVTDNCN